MPDDHPKHETFLRPLVPHGGLRNVVGMLQRQGWRPWLLLACLTVSSWCTANAQEAAPVAAMPKKYLVMFENHCLECHDAETRKGKLNLEDLSFEISKDIPTAEHWDNILAALNANEMPPEKKPPLPDDLKTAFLRDLSEQMVAARDILSDSGGEIVLRRLNRREYANTLEDLLGFEPDVSGLPPDSGGGGFDTFGSNLFFSSDQFQLYRATALKALRAAFGVKRSEKELSLRTEPEHPFYESFKNELVHHLEGKLNAMEFMRTGKEVTPDHPDARTRERRRVVDIAQAKKKLRLNELSIRATDYLLREEVFSGATMLTPRGPGPAKVSTPKMPVSAFGDYVLRVRAASYHDVPEFRRFLEYGFTPQGSSADKVLGQVEVRGSLKKPVTIEIPIRHPPGTAGSYFVRSRDYKEKSSRYAMNQFHFRTTGKGRPPALWVDYLELEGSQSWPVGAHRFVYPRVADESDEAFARRCCQSFAEAALRDQPIEEPFREALVARFVTKKREGMSDEDALIDLYATILTSPSFLYLIEPAEDGRSVPLTDRELAVRLSYFLWSAPPDAELMSLAREERLSNPDVLREQTARLLASPRVDQFVAAFAHQWLDMPRLDMFDFNSRHHPTFDESVRRSAREEVYATIRHILDHDLPLGTLLKADFVMVNDVLAIHYGLRTDERPLLGEAFRRVAVPPGLPRGGLLGMAAIHIMGSDGQRSSPVERGAWVLRHLLNDPPPPAPANVPMLSRLAENLPARELQRLHQEQPQCAQCHQKIDPLGYGLENFDAAGLWREKEVHLTIVKHLLRDRKEYAIDPSGRLTSGEVFRDFFELRDLVARRDEAFIKGFVEHLVAYALGRPYSFSDEKLVHEICATAATEKHPIAAIIHALVQSEPFQTK